MIGWEFLDAGLEKYGGENWFAGINDQFPTPFNLVSADINWFLATWFEIIGGTALIVGLGTRFFAISLMVLTIVAALAVHMPDQWNSIVELAKGYAISNDGHGNFKLPLMYFTMLIPFVFIGAGNLSVDALISKAMKKPSNGAFE
ncbi:MAG: putative oxidoreductase [Phenylobacterium sp.]